jgi:hypothetical protein
MVIKEFASCICNGFSNLLFPLKLYLFGQHLACLLEYPSQQQVPRVRQFELRPRTVMTESSSLGSTSIMLFSRGISLSLSLHTLAAATSVLKRKFLQLNLYSGTRRFGKDPFQPYQANVNGRLSLARKDSE